MSQNNELYESRLITNSELGYWIKSMRKERGWTQDVLAELSGLNIRTIQRIENGETTSNLHTRRALAKGLEFQDIDVFNKPFKFLNKEHISCETIQLSLDKITSGYRLREMVEISKAFHFEKLVELTNDGDKLFAELKDYLMDFDMCSDLYSEVGKLDVNQHIQCLIENLKEIGYVIGANIRNVPVIIDHNEKNIIDLKVISIFISSVSCFPEKIFIPKNFSFTPYI